MRLSMRLRRSRRPVLLAVAWFCWTAGVAAALTAGWPWAACCWAAGLCLLRAWWGWPWAAQLIFRREIRQFSATGTVTRFRLLQPYVMIPEPSKNDLPDVDRGSSDPA